MSEKGNSESRRKSNVIPALIVAVGLVAAGFLLKWPSAGASEKPASDNEPNPGEVVDIDSMTMSLSDGHFLRIGLAVELTEGTAAKDWEEGGDLSRFKDLVISNTASLSAEELTEDGGHKKLKEVLRSGSKKLFKEQVSDIYLTELLVQ